jgi:preprotein translocase subunit SecG
VFVQRFTSRGETRTDRLRIGSRQTATRSPGRRRREEEQPVQLAIDVLKWPGFNVAFLFSFFLTTALALVAIPYAKRRPLDRKASWGEAMFASTYAFGVMFLAFGVVPHQWIDHADKDLGWTRAKTLYGPGGVFRSQAEGGWFPFTLQYEAVRDIVVVLLHVWFFALLIFLWIYWQNRGKRAAAASTEVATSTYGRPLARKA